MKQISIFVENKEGKIRPIIKTLAENDINILALSIADTAKYGILRLIVSDNDKAIKCLGENNFAVREDEVVVVTVPDEPNGLNSILEILDKKNINLEYIYAFSSNKLDEAIVVMKLEDVNEAISLLKENNANILEKEDIEQL